MFMKQLLSGISGNPAKESKVPHHSQFLFANIRLAYSWDEPIKTFEVSPPSTILSDGVYSVDSARRLIYLVICCRDLQSWRQG